MFLTCYLFSPVSNNNFKNKGRIVPVNQIHSLDPAVQPRAWLDVMASILTTRDEKNEAMEEVLILAKDKRHARMFLEVRVLCVSCMYLVF